MKINEVTKKIEPSKPRNFVAKNATTSGAGQHKDKAKTIPRKEKHKGKQLDMSEGHHVVPGIDRERYTDLSHEGLEGPFRLKSGRVVYYDKKEGKYYDRDTDMYLSHDEHHQHEMDEDETAGTIGSVSPDGKQVTMKRPDGTDMTTTADAFVPGPNNTVTMKPDAAGDALKPGAQVMQQTSEAVKGIHAEKDKDLIGSGKNGDVGGDATDSFIDQVRDKKFEKSAKGVSTRSTVSENDELAKWLTIAGIK